MDKENGKRTLFLLIILLAILLPAYQAFNSNNATGLMEGAALPPLIYTSSGISYRLQPDVHTATLIIFFHPDCRHCKYQISEMNRYSHFFRGVRIFFLTEDSLFNTHKARSLWPEIFSRRHTYLGTIKAGVFFRAFGRAPVPSTFIFDGASILVKRIYGEISVERLCEVIKTRCFNR